MGVEEMAVGMYTSLLKNVGIRGVRYHDGWEEIEGEFLCFKLKEANRNSDEKGWNTSS